MEAVQLLQARRALAAENANGLLGGETIVAGGNRSVGGEDALVAHHGEVGVGGRAQRAAAQLAFEQRQGQQRGVALVHVIDVYMQPQCIGHAHAAHAQHDLLLQAIVGVATVEMVGEAAVPARVAVQIGVEQVDGNHVPGAALEVVAPGAHGYDAVFHRYRDPRRFFGAEVRRVPRLNVFALGARLVEMLLEIAFAVQQGEGDQGNSQVRRGTQRVAGQHAQAAGVGGHGGVNGDLHGEVSD